MYGYSTESTTKKISQPYFWICAKAPFWGEKKKVALNKEFEYKKKQTQKIPLKKTQYKEVWSNTLVNLSLKKKKKECLLLKTNLQKSSGKDKKKDAQNH